jgi:carbon monoxide dehydrogenase subunit G
MEFKGRYTLPATPDAVWSALNDPQVLEACLPGCEGMEKASEHEFKTVASVKIGRTKSRFVGSVMVSDLDPPRSCKLTAQGQGVAGIVKGTAKLRLVPSGEITVLDLAARYSIHGRLVQAGKRTFEAAVKATADQFFAKLAMQLGGEPTPPIHDHISMVPESHTHHGDQNTNTAADAVAPQIWVVGLVAVVAILLILFGMVL